MLPEFKSSIEKQCRAIEYQYDSLCKKLHLSLQQSKGKDEQIIGLDTTVFSKSDSKKFDILILAKNSTELDMADTILLGYPPDETEQDDRNWHHVVIRSMKIDPYWIADMTFEKYRQAMSQRSEKTKCFITNHSDIQWEIPKEDFNSNIIDYVIRKKPQKVDRKTILTIKCV